MSLDLTQPCPTLFNLTQYCIGDQQKRFSHKPALIFRGDSDDEDIFTYEEVWDTVTRLSKGLKQFDLPMGSRIMIRMPSSPDYAFIFFAAILAGFVPIPSYEGLTEEEALFIIDDAKSALLVVSNALAIQQNLPAFCKVITMEELHQHKTNLSLAPSTTSNIDPAYLVYTSGTTSRPKGVLHAQRCIWGRRPIRKCWLDISDRDIVLHTDTLNWTYTMGVLLMDTWASGATALLYTGEKSPSIWLELIKDYGVTLFASCPSTYVQILEHCPKRPFPLPTLRHCLSAGDVLKQSTLDHWQKRIGVPLYEALGMTEINLFINTGPSIQRKKGSIGKPQESRKIAILPINPESTALPPKQVGLLAIHRSDPGLMLGYWQRPEEEQKAFVGEWFLTGDLAHQDEESYIFYHGRIGTILNLDADMVSPIEVEAVLEGCPGIQEVACWAIPDPHQDLVLAAFVVPKKERPKADDIILYAKQHLADYKCPKAVYFLETLPKDARGKVLRRQLPDLVSQLFPFTEK